MVTHTRTEWGWTDIQGPGDAVEGIFFWLILNASRLQFYSCFRVKWVWNGLRPPPLLAMINTWALTPHPPYCSSVKNSNTHPPSSSSNLYPRISSSRVSLFPQCLIFVWCLLLRDSHYLGKQDFIPLSYLHSTPLKGVVHLKNSPNTALNRFTK